MSAIVTSFDSSWGGVGWAICTAEGPVESGHFVPDNSRWRLARLLDELSTINALIADCQIGLQAPGDPPPRVVVERPPWRYRGRGNQAATAYGIGTVNGAITTWGCRPDWSYPWEIPTRDDRTDKQIAKTGLRPGWRQWWNITGARPVAKATAIRLVRGLGWGYHLVRHADIDAAGDGPRGDVAEGILLGVGAARHLDQAPAGPAAWKRKHNRPAGVPT